MAYAILILISLVLLIGFLGVGEYEARRGARLFAAQRTRLDEGVARAEFILSHIDLIAFLRDELRRTAHRISHDIAHLSLQTVRAVERLLTRLVRSLRPPHSADVAPRGDAREFVKTLSDFKDRLKATRPEVGEIK